MLYLCYIYICDDSYVIKVLNLLFWSVTLWLAYIVDILHWENYIAIPFHSEWYMIVVTDFWKEMEL